MQEERKKKVVYHEGSEVRALVGVVEFLPDFVRVHKGDGEVLISHAAIVCIKDAGVNVDDPARK